MTDHNIETTERFWADVKPWEAAYTYAGLSFIAVRRDARLNLLHGRLFLHTAPPRIPRGHFESANTVAGYFPLSELGLNHHDLVEKIMASEPIQTPLGDLLLPLDAGNRPSTHLHFILRALAPEAESRS
jgi:hypothetical protein